MLAASRARVATCGGNEGAEQLRSELQVAQLRLSMAEGQKQLAQPLGVLLDYQRSKLQESSSKVESRLVEHLDRLRSACAGTESALSEARSELQASERRGDSLAEALASSEAAAELAGREWQEWERRCMGSERACATTAMRLDTAAAELEASRRSERSTQATAMQQRLRGAEAENAGAEAQAQARGFRGDALRLERAVTAGDREIQELRSQLQDSQARGGRAEAALERLARENQALREDRDAQHSALHATTERNGALASRCERLEAEAVSIASLVEDTRAAATAAAATAASAAATLAPVAASDPLPAAPATAPPAVWREAALMLPPAVQHRMRPASPQSWAQDASQKSRWDFPKSAASRAIRAQSSYPRS